MGTPKRVWLVGGGAWGTAMAVHIARRHEARLIVRRPEQAQALQSTRINAQYLPGVALPAGLDIASEFGSSHSGSLPDLLVLATPRAALASVLRSWLAQPSRAAVPCVWLCKGLAPAVLGSSADAALPGHAPVWLPHEAAHAAGLTAASGVLSGPSFAQEVAQGLPVALSFATTENDPDWVALVREVFHHHAMRIYSSEDLPGVELAGALKNVIAIAAGVSDGLALGLNARAALIARGAAEMSRLGQALGAQAQTFAGLAGIGDLLLTATGDLSRNRQLGLRLARGETLAHITATLGHVAEGVPTAQAARQLAEQKGVETPIISAVASVLFDGVQPAAAMRVLLEREPKPEF